MSSYTKQINNTLTISESRHVPGPTAVMLTQKNPEGERPVYAVDDIVYLTEEEAIAVYQFLHRMFGGT